MIHLVKCKQPLAALAVIFYFPPLPLAAHDSSFTKGFILPGDPAKKKKCHKGSFGCFFYREKQFKRLKSSKFSHL